MATITPARPAWAHSSGPRQRAWLPHATLATAATLTYLLIAVARWHRAGAASWDLGIFTEAVKGWATHAAPTVDIKGPGFNQLGDHWSPILALLAPLWWLWPSPLMLLAAQCALFGWSVGVVSATAARFVGRGNGLLIGLAYGLSFGLQNAIDAEFHEIAFAVPLVAVACRQLLLGRWERAVWWSLPLLLVKEDLGLTVAVVGVLAWWLGRRRILGTAIVAAGLTGTILEVTVLIPAFNPHHRYDYWHLTPHGTHGLWWTIGWEATQLVKWQTLGWTFGITAFVALRSPLTLATLPTLAWRMLGTNDQYWIPYWHYNAVLMPIVFLGAVDTLDRWRRSRRPRLRGFTLHGPTVIATIGVAACFAWPLPAALLAEPATWKPAPDGKAVKVAVQMVPAGVTVESWQDGLAAFAAKDDAYWIGGDPRPPQYALLVPASGNVTGMDRLEESKHPGTRYRVLFARSGVALLELQ
jgi:uncharacterized membrane protein